MHFFIIFIFIFFLGLVFYIHFHLNFSLSLLGFTHLRFLFDPLYGELVTNTSDLTIYLLHHLFFELVLPLSIFIFVMLTFFVDWSWIPISTVERARGMSIEEQKKIYLK